MFCRKRVHGVGRRKATRNSVWVAHGHSISFAKFLYNFKISGLLFFRRVSYERASTVPQDTERSSGCSILASLISPIAPTANASHSTLGLDAGHHAVGSFFRPLPTTVTLGTKSHIPGMLLRAKKVCPQCPLPSSLANCCSKRC